MFRFQPSVGSLEARDVPSAISGRITPVVVDPTSPGMSPKPVLLVIANQDHSVQQSNQGWGKWEVNIATLPGPTDAAPDGRKYKMLVAPLILELDNAPTRATPSGKIILWVRDVDQTSGEQIGPLFNFKADRLQPVVYVVGGGMLRIVLQDDPFSAGVGVHESITIGGPQVGSSDRPHPTIILQRLANPSLPDSSGNARSNVFAGWLTVGLSDSSHALRELSSAENGGVTFYLDAASRGELQGTLFIAKQQARRTGGNDSIWIDIAAPIQVADQPGRHFNGFVSRFSAGDGNETITIHANRTESTRSNVHAVWLTVGF